jgi:uncharacterized protein
LTDDEARRLRPFINQDVAPYWGGLQERKLNLQRCKSCRELRFPFQPICGSCQSDSWELVESLGAGTVYSFTRVHHPPQPGFPVPYVVGLIELDEGARIVGLLKDEPDGGFEIGTRVGVSYTVDRDFTFADFSPLEAPAEASTD